MMRQVLQEHDISRLMEVLKAGSHAKGSMGVQVLRCNGD